MSGIQDSSKKIADIIGVIDSIAFQTNILALNAAVEAARAGEHGKGFAVVSTDIRSLAQDSQTNTEKINDIIELMNAEIDNVNTDWNNLLKSQDREQGIIDNLINNGNTYLTVTFGTYRVTLLLFRDTNERSSLDSTDTL
jgi:methyl-accepting chemotaxis protein